MAKEVRMEITIPSDGSNPTFDADGYPDGSCLKVMEEVAKALGSVSKQVKKAEAHKVAPAAKVELGKK